MLLLIFLVLFCSGILALSVRGLPGNPSSQELSTIKWKENGPFELSPERGRFALLYSIVEDHSFFFTQEIAQFAAPDVGTHNGKYVSLFAPLVSYIAIPGYVLGRYVDLAQVGAFATVAIFAILNLLLLRSIAIKLGAHPIAATIGACTFLFATPAFSYAVTLYQHHISTFLILLSIWALLKSQKPWTLALVFFLCALAIPLDYPNLFFMFPIGLYALGRIVILKKIKESFQLRINLLSLVTPLIMILPILFFLWFNQSSYGNPLQLSGTVQTAEFGTNTLKQDPEDLETKLNKAEEISNSEEKSSIAFFNTRDILNGFYIHILSPDRGILYFAPAMFFGLIGLVLALLKKVKFAPLLTAILGANLLLYSMWGDPWGGWAFGSRYLIPSYALLSIFISLFITYLADKPLVLVTFILVTYYSVAVNILGGLTTSAMPPQVQILELEKISGSIQKYTYARNWDMLLAGHTKSFVFQTYLDQYLNAQQFYILITISIILCMWFMLLYYIITTDSQRKDSLS